MFGLVRNAVQEQKYSALTSGSFFLFFNSGSSFHTQAVVSWRRGGLLLSENIFLDRKMAKQYVYRFAVNWLYLRRLSKICVLKTSDP